MITRTRIASTLISTALLLAPALALAAFDTNLSVGARGSAVIELQQFLISRGHLASGNNTGYFGPLTLAAVKAFQSSQGVQPISGFFGPLTRAKANARIALQPITPSCPLYNACPSGYTANISTDSNGCTVQTCVPPSSNAFTASPTSGAAPLTVQFYTRVVGRHPGGPIYIDFGDGTIGATACPVPDACSWPGVSAYTYTSPGTYTAKLRTGGGDPTAGQCNGLENPDCNVVGTVTITVTSTPSTSSSATSCSAGGTTVVVSGASATFYDTAQPTLAPGASCASHAQTRMCTNGSLSGSSSYSYATCTEPVAPSTTTWPLTMYANVATVPYGGSTTVYWSTSIPLTCSFSVNGVTTQSGVTVSQSAIATGNLYGATTYLMSCAKATPGSTAGEGYTKSIIIYVQGAGPGGAGL